MRPREHGGEVQRVRETESQADSPLSVERNAGLHLMTLRLQPELEPRVGHLANCDTQVPPEVFRS